MSGSSTCPRCGAAFHCGVLEAAPCPCTTPRLDQATLQALRESYSGCVCMPCLASVSVPRLHRVDAFTPLPPSLTPTDEDG